MKKPDFVSARNATEQAVMALAANMEDDTSADENAVSAESDAPALRSWVCRYCKQENPPSTGKFCIFCGKSKLPEARTTIHSTRPDLKNPRCRRVNLLVTEDAYEDIATLAIIRNVSVNQLVFKTLEEILADNREVIDRFKSFRKENGFNE